MCCGPSRCAPTSPRAARPRDCAPHPRHARGARPGAAGGCWGLCQAARAPSRLLLRPLRPSPPRCGGGAWKGLACHLPTVPGSLGTRAGRGSRPEGARARRAGTRSAPTAAAAGAPGTQSAKPGCGAPRLRPGASGLRVPEPPPASPPLAAGRARRATLASRHGRPRPLPAPPGFAGAPLPSPALVPEEAAPGRAPSGSLWGSAAAPPAGLRASCCAEGAAPLAPRDASRSLAGSASAPNFSGHESDRGSLQQRQVPPGKRPQGRGLATGGGGLATGGGARAGRGERVGASGHAVVGGLPRFLRGGPRVRAAQGARGLRRGAAQCAPSRHPSLRRPCSGDPATGDFRGGGRRRERGPRGAHGSLGRERSGRAAGSARWLHGAWTGFQELADGRATESGQRPEGAGQGRPAARSVQGHDLGTVCSHVRGPGSVGTRARSPAGRGRLPFPFPPVSGSP